jgi:IstB-like ATP binding protein
MIAVARLLAGRAVLRSAGDAEADRQRRRVPCKLLLYACPQSLGHEQRLLHAGLWQQQAELLTADARRDVHGPGVIAQQRADALQRAVALEHPDANRFFQLINRRYTRSSMIITSNKRVSEWTQLFGDEVLAAAILDRLLHDGRRAPHDQRPLLAATRPHLSSARTPTRRNVPNAAPTDHPRRPRHGPQIRSHAAD